MAGSKWEFTSFTFTELRELYENHPDEFAELADDAIRQACNGRTPEHTTELKQLQWTIDMQLRKAKTPLRRLQVMESIFYGQVFGDGGSLHQLRFGCSKILNTADGIVHVQRHKPVLRLVKK